MDSPPRSPDANPGLTGDSPRVMQTAAGLKLRALRLAQRILFSLGPQIVRSTLTGTKAKT